MMGTCFFFSIVYLKVVALSREQCNFGLKGFSWSKKSPLDLIEANWGSEKSSLWDFIFTLLGLLGLNSVSKKGFTRTNKQMKP